MILFRGGGGFKIFWKSRGICMALGDLSYAFTIGGLGARSPEKIFKNDATLPFKKLVIHRIGIQMFKYHKGMVPKSVCELFTLNSSNHSYNTRNKDKIRSAYGKHKFMYRNFRFISVHVWNYLASNIIINTTLTDFKNKSKIFIMSNKFTLTLT